MKLDNLMIIEQLERLAAACPWDPVEITIRRKPEGEYGFSSFLSNNDKFGFQSVYAWGCSPQEVVDNIIKQTTTRTPGLAREAAIAELKRKIQALEAVVIGLPPYKPGRELSERSSGAVNVPDTINV